MGNATDQHQTGILAAWVAARDQARAEDPPTEEEAQSPLPARRSAGQLAAEAVAKAAQKSLKMPIYVESSRISALSLAEIGELLPERALLAVLQSDADSIGALALCPATVASLLEMQTLGRVTPRPVAQRRSTRTDATLCADFINTSLNELGAALQNHADASSFYGYRYASHMDDPRPLLLMLEDRGYDVLQLSMRYGEGGQRDGQIIVFLPSCTAGQGNGAASDLFTNAGPASLPGPTMATNGTSGQDHPQATSIRDLIQSAPVQLEAILTRRQMRLGDLRRLKPGDCIPLSHHAIANVRLESRNQLLALGKLGEADGCHALRLRPPHCPEMGDIADASPLPQTEMPSPDMPSPDLEYGTDELPEITAEDDAPAEHDWPEPPIEDLSVPDEFRTEDPIIQTDEQEEEETDIMPMAMQIT